MAPIPENRKLPKREADLFKSILVSSSTLFRAYILDAWIVLVTCPY